MVNRLGHSENNPPTGHRFALFLSLLGPVLRYICTSTYFPSTTNVQTEYSSETSARIYQSTRRDVLQECSINLSAHNENL
jgi:hypothetical protein